MCGRFTLTISPGQLQAAFPWVEVPPDLSPRYNIAPTQPVAVIPNDGNNRLDFFTWGLIPSWSKDPKIGSRLINARAETLHEKPAFRAAFRRRRCLVLADGFYEWRQEPTKKGKNPMYIRLKSEKPFSFAGLWENWYSPDGSKVLSCTIITTSPNNLVERFHNRMPAILSSEVYSDWLEPGDVEYSSLRKLLKPYPDDDMIAFPVSRLVNSPDNDVPECIQPLSS
ncbi:MAG: SOS response-associated peptidase [Anaerolineales bacterium]